MALHEHLSQTRMDAMRQLVRLGLGGPSALVQDPFTWFLLSCEPVSCWMSGAHAQQYSLYFPRHEMNGVMGLAHGFGGAAS
jgi:hypothetical protein